ncbi:hypothetical protein CERZMDRAFT_121264 [Cercospora zeae-maydis SCOH1-5]|uniref:Uncharacterized protein n=1 Tax=Cercospora zeae-maydis SCOH1-5 TaxID=717836 RepID=A0A6A6FGH8_9PEZI|nr:hypothetical protein CERZMDRAFT_121264 [Cercospora zeae-maydis SCOH1-5]
MPGTRAVVASVQEGDDLYSQRVPTWKVGVTTAMRAIHCRRAWRQFDMQLCNESLNNTCPNARHVTKSMRSEL